MSSIKNLENETSVTGSNEASFVSKMRGALLLSGRTFTSSYKSSKLWQGYFIAMFCIGLLSFVLSTSTFPFFTEIFPPLVFSFTFLGITLWISFSPLFFFLSFLLICGFWIGISLFISYFKRLKLKRTASALGFALTPLLILTFYLLNKFLLQSFKYELGPFLLALSVCWSILCGLVGITNIIGFEFGGLLNYSFKSIIFRKKRTYAAIIGIAVAVGLIVTPIPLVSGYYSQLNKLASDYQHAQYIILLEDGKSEYISSYIDNSILSSLYHSNIEAISPETYLIINLSLNSSVNHVNLRGINYSIFQNFRNSLSFQIISGGSFSDDQIFIGNLLAEILNISYAKLPINITLSYGSKTHNATIIGILTSNIHYDTELFAPVSLTWSLNPELIGKFSLIEAKLKDPTLIDSTLETLRAVYPDLYIQRENQLSNFVSGLIDKTIQSIWMLSIVVYIAMGFGMYHVMQTIIKESEREIAILKSVGSSRFQIIRIFFYQTIILSLVGSILGVLSAIFLTYMASFLVSSITAITVQPLFDLFAISTAILLGLTAGILGSLYPAYKAAKISVGEIIK